VGGSAQVTVLLERAEPHLVWSKTMQQRSCCKKYLRNEGTFSFHDNQPERSSAMNSYREWRKQQSFTKLPVFLWKIKVKLGYHFEDNPVFCDGPMYFLEDCYDEFLYSPLATFLRKLGIVKSDPWTSTEI